MAKRDDGLTGPVSTKQRIQELDVLRGIALFGVLVMNFIGFAGEGVMLTETQMAALPTATLDHGAYWGVRLADRRQGQYGVRDVVRAWLLSSAAKGRGQTGV